MLNIKYIFLLANSICIPIRPDRFYVQAYSSLSKAYRLSVHYSISSYGVQAICTFLKQQLKSSIVFNRRQRRRRQFWVRPWIQRRPMYGNYENLMLELERESRGDFVNFMRMEPRMFHELLLRVTPRLTKQETNYRRPLDPGLKLAITLRYMASGNSYRSLSYSFRVPYNTISGTVKEVAEAILAEYEEETFDFPTTPDRWRQVSHIFLPNNVFACVIGLSYSPLHQ